MNLKLILIVSALSMSVQAQSPVTVTIEPHFPGAAIPEDFVGLSFGMKTLPPNREGEHFFSPTNAPLIALFRELGIRHFRAGGTTVEWPAETRIPDEADIDNLFDFARAAGVNKIIYSLRLLGGDPADDARIAKYIWDYHRSTLECFALGNEPDRKSIYSHDSEITNFSSYLKKWRRFATAITNVVPEAKFAGPDAGSGNVDWTTRFAKAEKDSGVISVVTEHYYAGGAGKGVSAAKGIEGMLSADWLTNSEKLYDKMALPVLAAGLPYRFTEANDHYSGGIPDASDTFAGALWSLDFLHWWAEHGARGVDFHNTEWVSSDIIHLDDSGRPVANPKGYGLKVFDLGAHGRTQSVSIFNPNRINLTAYAVRDGKNLLVTVINKEHNPSARASEVTISSGTRVRAAKAIFLTAVPSDAAAKSGINLGNWKTIAISKEGQCSLSVAPTSAAIVRIE